MCDSCFNSEYEKFTSQEYYNEFEIELDKRIRKKNLELFINENYKNESDFLYRCIKCNTVWCLSIPENVWRGYFLTKENTDDYFKKIKRQRQKRNIGCWLILLLIMTLILIFVLK